MFRTDGASLRRVLGAPARITGLGVAVLLVGATLAAGQAPTVVRAAAATISIDNGDTATTPSTLASILLAPGETLSGAVTINGDPAFGTDDQRLRSYGTFSNGTADVGIDSGLIITANADAASFLTASNINIIQGVAGDRPDPALENLLETQPGICTAGADECIHNATDLSFSIVPNDNFIKFNYTLLMTETGIFENSAWSGNVSLYPDGFGLFVNGESPENNCAAVPSTGEYLTMKTAGIVPPQGNAAANRAAALATVEPNQKFAYATENPLWAVQFLTVPLTCIVDVTDAYTNQTPVSIRIVVADVKDDQVPPAVLLEAGSLHFEETSSPVWQDFTLGTIQLGVTYVDGVSASGGPPPTYSVNVGTLPAGLLLNNATGEITGTPTAAGAYAFTITVSNLVLPDLVKQFTGDVAVAPAWTDSTIAAAFQVGVAVNDGVVASGTPAPTYSVSAGTLPAGLSLNAATGAITGSPTSSGAYSFTIRAANGIGSAVNQGFSGTVVAAPVWTDQTIAVFRVGLAVSDGVAASGTPTPTYSVTAGALPAGLSLNTATGAITGTPTATAGGHYNFTLRAVNGIGAAVTKTFTGTVFQPAGGFFAIAPVRLLDTRDAGDSLVGGTVRRLPIAGTEGIPADATSVALNVTATNGTMSGFITVFPCESSVPLASNVNFLGGETVASLVSVSLDSDGGVCLFSNVATDVVVDISGAYSLSQGVGRLEAAEPYRIADTREGGTRLTAGTSFAVDVSGRGAPSDATAMLLNLTVDDPTTAGFVTAYPCGGAVPLASNLNFAGGQTIANSAVVRIGTDHTVCFYVSTDTHLVVDVNGWYSPGSSVGFPTKASPQRLLDTRTTGGPAAGGTVQELDLNGLISVPANATSVTLNVTVDGPKGSGFVTVYPCSSDRPLASNLNFVAGQTVPNSATVPVGATRAVCVFTTATTHLVIDLNQVYSTFD